MIVQNDAERRGHDGDLFRRFDIRRRWGRISGWVVVDHPTPFTIFLILKEFMYFSFQVVPGFGSGI